MMTSEKIEQAQESVGGEAAPAVPVDAAAELAAKVEKLEDNLLRARAEFQNLQRRSATERTDAIRFANAELMKALVKVVDDFERALASPATDESQKAFMAGMKLVHGNLTKALAEHGLETIEALHKPFDPAYHEALLQKPADAHPPGTVVEQVARGYQLSGRVIRPAKVIVAKAHDAEK